MKAQRRTNRRLSTLTLSKEITARSRIQSQFRWFRPPGNQVTSVKKTTLEKRQRTNFLKRLAMKIRIRLLRWLSLLQFPALPIDLTEKLSHFALFRRPPAIELINTIYKTLKYKQLKF